MYKQQTEIYKCPENKRRPVWRNIFAAYSSGEAVMVFICAFLTARVMVLDTIRPFAIAFLIAVYYVFDIQYVILAAIAAVLGQASIGSFQSLIQYCMAFFMVSFICFICMRNKKKTYAALISAAIASFSTSMIFCFISNPLAGIRHYIIISTCEAALVGIGTCIFKHGVLLCIKLSKRKHLSKEEWMYIISIAGIVISGIWRMELYDISVSRIILLGMVLLSGYTGGPAMGTASGLIIGLISSTTGAGGIDAIGIYSFSGFISGVFHEKRKYAAAITFLVSYSLIGCYTSGGILYAGYMAEGVICTAIFVVIREELYGRIKNMLDTEKRGIQLQRQYTQRVREIMGGRLSDISMTLADLSEVLNETSDSDTYRKLEVDGVVENIADKVCAVCEGRNLCWKKEFYKTYDSFRELMERTERQGRVCLKDMPDDLQRKCIRANELIRQVNSVFEIFKLNTRWKRKIFNSKKIVGQQLENVSQMVKRMVDEVSTSFEFKNDIEEDICNCLERNGLEFDDAIAVKDKYGKYEVCIYRSPCSGKQACIKEYASVISNVLGVKMIRDSMKCRLNSDCSMCQFRLREAECYNVAAAMAQRSKSQVCGDSCYYDNINKGKYMLAISDGMGSGKIASMESGVTISLLEKLMAAGYERDTAIKAINSVLILRSCDESYATIDMGIIDLYSGMAEFIKIGSASTFIKSEDGIRILKSSSLPVGILDDVDIESEIIELKDGDMVIMVTDGAEDSMGPDNDKWIIKAISSIESGNPRDVADGLMQMCENNYGGEIKDDITVLACKIWKQYN